MIIILFVGWAVFLLLIGCPFPAGSAPPAGADPSSAIANWFHDLEVPGKPGTICCSIADCRPVLWRERGGHYEVWIDHKTFDDEAINGIVPDDWVIVPDATVIHRTDNPMGEAVACFYRGELRCFVAGPET